jgi:hypothetical protein
VINANLEEAQSDPAGFVARYQKAFGRPIDDRQR